MYAIVNIAGKQYRVAEGDQIRVANLPHSVGEKVNINSVLLLDTDKGVQIGSPTVPNSQVAAHVVEHGRERKILIYKKKRRKGYQRKNGHRQGYTLLQIDRIQVKAGAKKAKTTKKAEKETDEKES
jgi:large subunit ribosomal protein L21